MIRYFFLAFIRIHILHHAAKEPVYGLLLIEELRHHGYDVGAATLYPILHDLTEAGYLTRQDRLVGGRIRKYYSISRAGLRALALARTQIRELVEEVLEDRGPSRVRVRPARRTSRVSKHRAAPAKRSRGDRATIRRG
jgi:DNA-binding PadR family transcriptional regulator